MDKQHILDEIKRTAQSNGGKALGIGRFEKATGIGMYDWYGKYWKSWNEALAEAGLGANRLQVAYTEVFLIENLISLAREVGHFPRDVDLRKKAFDNSEFPAHRTFSRLGGKAARAKKMLAFCENRSGYADVLEICRPIASQPSKQSKDVEGETGRDGFVYLVRSGKRYKIGKTRNLERRIPELGYQSPERVELVHQIQTDDPSGIEAYWHKRFAEKRVREEWFELSPRDVAAFKRRKTFM